MAIIIACPHCQETVQMPEEFQGRNVRCPKCQSEFVAQAPTDITAMPPRSGWAGESGAIQTGLPAGGESRPSRSRELRYASAADADSLAESILSRGPFRPGGGLVLAVEVLLTLNLVLSVVILGSEFLQYNLATRLVAREDVPLAEINSNDARQMLLGILHLLIYIVTGILFLMWFYRAHANLRPLGAQDLTYTSGWAAGAWFVPILNLFRPVQIAQEIWRNSDPNIHSEDDSLARPATASALVGFWWAAWIISNIIGQISMRISLQVNSPETLLSATGLAMFAEVTSIVACCLVLAVVFRVDARQNARAEALRALAAQSQGPNEYR